MSGIPRYWRGIIALAAAVTAVGIAAAGEPAATVPAAAPSPSELSAPDLAPGPSARPEQVKPDPVAVPLQTALAELGACLEWDPFSGAGVLATAGHRIAFIAGRAAGDIAGMVDGRELVRAASPRLENGVLVFPADFIAAASDALRQAAEKQALRYRIAAILVDPGHGGKDTGAVAAQDIDGKRVDLVEKAIALQVALDFHARLAAAYPDKQVLLTRTSDTYPTLEQRVQIANDVVLEDNEAIIFVSIHANASFNKNARGYEVWYLSPEYRRDVIDESAFTGTTDVVPILNAMLEEEFTTESLVMADAVMRRFDQTIGKASPSRGIKAEEWFVVRNARMPSILVELGFVTNSDDAALLSDPAYLRKLSDALYNGIADFVATFERSGGFTAVR